MAGCVSALLFLRVEELLLIFMGGRMKRHWGRQLMAGYQRHLRFSCKLSLGRGRCTAPVWLLLHHRLFSRVALMPATPKLTPSEECSGINLRQTKSKC